MNIDQWEDKIISYLEGDLGPDTKQEILDAASQDKAIKSLWLSYTSIYNTIDDITPAEISDHVKTNFDTFIKNEISLQQTKKTEVVKAVSIPIWKKIMAVAAISIGILFIWNTNQSNQEINNSLADVNSQLDEILENKSATEKIKVIRVSHDNQSPSTDEKTKQLLVNVLKNDPSSNVRLAAVEALATCTDDDKIREALIKSLMKEKDGFVRLALVNALGQQFDHKVADTFEEIVSDKTNEKFIRDEVEKELFRHNKIES